MKNLRFCLIVFMIVFSFLLVACSGSSDETSPSSSTEDTTSTLTTTTSVPTDSSTASTTAETPATKAPLSLPYREDVVSEDAFISVPSASYISGTLLHIEKGSPYRYNTTTLVPNSKIPASSLQILGQNLMILYGNKSQDYLLATSSLFMKSDAFPYWEKLIAAFREETGKTSLQIVNAYLYNSETAIESPFVTGYSVAVNLYEDGVVYSLASEAKSVTVNGESMTCLSWFLDHCAEYGFIYTGLTGSESQPLATFRFVGVPHALVMSFYDIIDMKVYSDFIRTTTPAVKIKDNATDIEWTFKYFPITTDSDTTIVRLPIGAVYSISGDNMGGFIVAYYVPGGYETGV